MKKLLFTLFAVIAFTASVFADDDNYVVVKNDNQTTIYKLPVGASGTLYICTFTLTNPTVKELTNIGLPSHCWPWVNGENGAFDTRLVKAERDLTEMKANYENEQENARYLEGDLRSKDVLLTFLSILFLGALAIIFSQIGIIKNLKKQVGK